MSGLNWVSSYRRGRFHQAIGDQGIRTGRNSLSNFAGRSLTESAEAIADYAETAGKRRKEHDTVHGTQPGDPARAAAALVDVITSGKAPELLVLGSDALEGYRLVADGQRAEVDAWEHVSTSTDFERS